MKEVLIDFGEYLAEQGLYFEVTIIGGAALLIMGVIDRATQDVDCLDPEIPETIQKAAIQFAGDYKKFKLKNTWLNNGPKDLRSDLPDGWQKRVIGLHKSNGIHIQTLGRMDLLKTKLFAYCDRQQDEQDCISLAPTAEELQDSIEWLIERDGNPLWPEHVKTSLINLAERIGYEFRP